MSKDTYIKHISISFILLLLLGATFFVLNLQTPSIYAQTPTIPAFPGAEGFGAQSVGRQIERN